MTYEQSVRVGLECLLDAFIHMPWERDTFIDVTTQCICELSRWIPVSEGLPEEDGFYLATCDGEICGKDEPISVMAEFENGKWVDDEDDYQCVLAWMPLPEPYEEAEE